jgi:hypothetical protein
MTQLDLSQLSREAGAALADADAHGAGKAAAFLRLHWVEICRALRGKATVVNPPPAEESPR